MTMFPSYKKNPQISVSDTLNPFITNWKLFVVTGICIVLYIVSMYISNLIYSKKEIGN